MTDPGQTNAPSSGAPTAADEQLLARLRAATLGVYEIYGELGRGGMATVYLAHEIALDRKVAIKVMSPALFFGPGMVERFKREARTSASLSHPNIIPIYAVREAEGLLFFVMKLVEGTPLDSIMREVGKLPVPMVEAILAQVGGAFGYAHRHGVVHRDIKPSNILIDDEGWAVVTDFGIAKVQESEALTQSGVAVGTPTYMSPEQCNGAEITGASDQYSLGVVAYEMLTGRPPFTGYSLMSLMNSHFNDPPPPLENFRSDCPAPLRDAVMRMLAKPPAARWPTMEEAVTGLGGRHLAHDDPTRSQLITLARSGTSHRIISQVQTPRSPVPLTRSHPAIAPESTGAQTARRSKWLIAAGALVVLAAATVLLTRPRQIEPIVPPQASQEAVIPPAPPPSVPPARETTSTTAPFPVSPPAAPRSDKRPPSSAGGKPALRVPVTAANEVPAVIPEVITPVTPTAPPPAPSPVPSAPTQRAVVDTPAAVAPSPAARAADDRADVSAVILAYARALQAGDLAEARRMYPEMPVDQRQGLEAFWRAGGSMQPRWSVSDITVDGDLATARVQGTNTVSTARGRPTEERVSLRARLQRSGGVWRLLALVN